MIVFLVLLQVITCMIITIAYASTTARQSCGMFALLNHIQRHQTVPYTAPISLRLRGLGALATCLGTLLCGFRLAPVTGAPFCLELLLVSLLLCYWRHSISVGHPHLAPARLEFSNVAHTLSAVALLMG